MNIYKKMEAEGGCGVIGLACEEKVAGKHLLSALKGMCNRGNGKGGGIAASGLSPQTFGVSQETLDHDYMLTIAYLDPQCRHELEHTFIHPVFDIDHIYEFPHIADYRTIQGLEVHPPDATVYFVHVKDDAVQAFKAKHNTKKMTQTAIQDEIVYQNTYQLNKAFYSASGDKRAFVLSHGKNMLVLKMVGYGDEVIRYYQLEEFVAHVWIGHHRYPTKGKVWHPGGAHPFIGLNEALVHNGDFANYYSICEYLAQRNIHPLFLTDTEVAVLVFDLLYRNYQYPLEYVIEALAPTTERDFTMLPKDKREVYQLLQKTHMHGSPDGPWFFLVAQSVPESSRGPFYRLIGITDTSMLRPQVFALQTGKAAIGLSASEKQAIDAVLKSLSEENSNFWSCADYYWNARGGSHTDGGAFVFAVHPTGQGKATLACTDKFGQPIHVKALKSPATNLVASQISIPDLSIDDLYAWMIHHLKLWDYSSLCGFLEELQRNSTTNDTRRYAIEILTKLIDGHFFMGNMRRSSVIALVNSGLSKLFNSIIENPTSAYTGMSINAPAPYLESAGQTLIIDACGFPSEGRGSLALTIVQMYKRGFKKMIIFNCQGQRFIANGLGPQAHNVQIDVYGSSGDYLASGIDGANIIVHGSAQDQLAQIMLDGTLVVHGDVGQTFMYGAKGGKAFVKGNAAGRPMINAVGKPRVVINGTCLDYLAESFMAGDPLNGGGFVIVNGIAFDEEANIVDLDTPYPGNNLFSLASGGAIYIRDPMGMVSDDQLNGGELVSLKQDDWDLILPNLQENERLFNIPVSRLLHHRPYNKVYRKIKPIPIRALQEEEAWVKSKD